MGKYMELTDLGEEKRMSFEQPKEVSGPEETWYNPQTYDEWILNELGQRQPADEEMFLEDMESLGEPHGKVRASLRRLSYKDYITL